MKKPKSIADLKKQLWDVFALWIKQKYSDGDGNCNCFTCGAPLKIGTSNCQGGHFYSKKGFPALYFHENNSRCQCYHCNIHLMGNTQIFREKLIEEIGEEGVAELDKHRHDNIKLSRSDYEEKIRYYSELIKTMR